MTVILRGLIACVESDLKRIVAMSTLSQLGIIFFILSVGEVVACFCHMVSHALFKSLLFLICGFCILRGYGSQSLITHYGSLFNYPFEKLILIVSGFNLIGFPFTSGFFTRDFILELSLAGEMYVFVNIAIVLGCVLTVLYRFRLFRLTSFEKSFKNPQEEAVESWLVKSGLLVLGV